jgi:PTS system fructose-specific IIA component
MQLKDLFQPCDFAVGFAPGDKWTAIRDLMDHLVAAGRVDAQGAEDLLEHVLERERSMSTGMERGIAIPHAAVDGLPDVVAALGIVASEQGLAFESIDGRPTHLVVLLLIPRAQKLLHIRTLADIARVLGKETVRTALRAATSAEEAWAILASAESAAV